jgi:hypothetical protein
VTRTFSGLYLFTANNQHDRASPKKIIGSSETFKDVKRLSAASVNSTTTVWALNDQGELFYFSCTSCTAGKGDQSEAWSTSPPILVQVSQFSDYLNGDNSSNVIFVQDPTTSAWSMLPMTDGHGKGV